MKLEFRILQFPGAISLLNDLETDVLSLSKVLHAETDCRQKSSENTLIMHSPEKNKRILSVTFFKKTSVNM